MKTKVTHIVQGLTAGVLIALGATLLAGQVNLPNTFTAGTPAMADQVNANFNAVAAEVNDNAIRLNTIEANVDSGNLVLAPSNAATGNVLKGADRFIHDFGFQNTFIGLNSGNFAMTGGSNTASGFQALSDNTIGSNNTASGTGALANNTTGSFNTASGANALAANTTGNINTASGRHALRSNTTGFNNTASGANALADNTTGSNNTASGTSALDNNTTGSNNIAIGSFAGTSLTTGHSNIAIGHPGVAGDSETIRLGLVQTRAFIAGIRGRTTGTADAINVMIDSSGQLGTVSSSRHVKDDITAMGEASSVLMQLRPVTFHYKSDRDPEGRTLQYGLVAEEVAKVAPGLVARKADGAIETVFYHFLPPMLLNEYQKQQRTIAAQAETLAQQTARIAELEQDRLQQSARLQQQTDRLAALERQFAHIAATFPPEGREATAHAAASRRDKDRL